MKNYSTKFKNFHLLLITVFVFSFFIFSSANAATLSLEPNSGSFYNGDSFIVDVMLNTEGEDINVIDARITFSSDLLDVLDVSRGGSIIGLWVEDPSFSNSRGTASFIGGIPGGFNGEGLIGQLIFEGKNSGNARVDISDNSKILLNNGKGTPAQTSFIGANYGIKSKPAGLPSVSSNTHPDENRWYQEDTVRMQWDVNPSAIYRYALTEGPQVAPFSPSNAPIGDVRYESVDEGIFYFLLQQKFQQDDSFSPSLIRRVMIDNSPPESFEAKVADIEGKKYLIFATSDRVSGIDYYEILKTEVEGGGLWRKAVSPYLLSEDDLRGIIKVKAVDKAQNETIVTIKPVVKTFFGIPYLILALIILVSVLLVFNYFKEKIFRNKKSK